MLESGAAGGSEKAFDVPPNVSSGARSILGFTLKVWHADDMNLKLRMNGTEVWDWNWSGEGTHLQYFQEVMPAGLIKPGNNVLSFDSSSGDFRQVQLSDVVVWWQANI
ncbi:MAG: hypothetical protein K0S64_968 [Gaiellaceae bacterium]|jgi:hypothetical protein|nr:hypothetical protein [Gaiellaceae bacterium]